MNIQDETRDEAWAWSAFTEETNANCKYMAYIDSVTQHIMQNLVTIFYRYKMILFFYKRQLDFPKDLIFSPKLEMPLDNFIQSHFGLNVYRYKNN